MKIYTKTGDSGETSLFGGERVLKNHPRLAAYGTADELNAQLGFLVSHLTDNSIINIIQTIQRRLFIMGSQLATPVEHKNWQKIDKLTENDVSDLEKTIDQWNEELAELKSFILPGGTVPAAISHIARTICRRLERELMNLSDQIKLDQIIIKYVNRLSDFLFVLARLLNHRAGEKDINW